MRRRAYSFWVRREFRLAPHPDAFGLRNLSALMEALDDPQGEPAKCQKGTPILRRRLLTFAP